MPDTFFYRVRGKHQGKIGEDAKKLSDLCTKPIPGASFTQSLETDDNTIGMDSPMDGNLMKGGAPAHVQDLLERHLVSRALILQSWPPWPR